MVLFPCAWLVRVAAIVCALFIVCGCLLCQLILDVCYVLICLHYWMLEQIVKRHSPHRWMPRRPK